MSRAGGSYLYFIQVAPSGDNMLIFSPHGPSALLVKKGQWASRREVLIGVDHWLVNGWVIGPKGVLDLNELRRFLSAS